MHLATRVTACRVKTGIIGGPCAGPAAATSAPPPAFQRLQHPIGEHIGGPGAVRSLRPSALAPFEKPRPAAAPAQLPRCSSRLTYPRVLRTAQHAQEAGNRPARKHGEPVLASGGSACLPGLVPLPAEVTRLPRNLETRLAAGPSRRRPERRPRHTLLANVLARAPAAPRAAPPKSPLWET